MLTIGQLGKYVGVTPRAIVDALLDLLDVLADRGDRLGLGSDDAIDSSLESVRERLAV